MEANYIAGKYLVTNRVGKGAFGEIFRGVDRESGLEVAIKMEEVTTKHQQLYAECKIYLWLHCSTSPPSNPTESNPKPPQPPVPIPYIYHYGLLAGSPPKNILVMSMLGESLQSIVENPTHRP